MLYHIVLLSVLSVLSTTQKTKRNRRDGKTNRIVNGTPTEASDFPFIVSMRVSADPDQLETGICGGSLWRKEWPATIITAAHCYDNDPILGVSLLRSDDNAPLGPGNMFLSYPVFGQTLHPQYDINDDLAAYDIALVFLNADLSDNDDLECVTIPDSLPANLAPVTVIGYGADFEDGPATDTLEFTNLNYLDETEQICMNSAPVATTSFCANAADTDSCQGDSGGPLVLTGTNEQVGIVSTGEGCNRPTTAGIYTNLPSFSDWVDDTLAAFIAANVGSMPTSAVTPAPVTPAPVTPAPIDAPLTTAGGNPPDPAPGTPAPVEPVATPAPVDDAATPAPVDNPAPTMATVPAPTTSTAAPSGVVFDALVALYGETVATLIYNGQVPAALLAELVAETAPEILNVILSGDLNDAEVQQLLTLLNTSIAELILLEAGGTLSGSLSDSADSS